MDRGQGGQMGLAPARGQGELNTQRDKAGTGRRCDTRDGDQGGRRQLDGILVQKGPAV